MTPHAVSQFHAMRGVDLGGLDFGAWIRAGALDAADVAVASRLAATGGDRTPSGQVVLAFALALRAERSGSALVDLEGLDVSDLAPAGRAIDALSSDADALMLPTDREAWIAAVAGASPLVVSCDGSGRTLAPYVLDGTRLYSARSILAERRIADGVERLVAALPPKAEADPLVWVAARDAVLGCILGEGDGWRKQREAAGAVIDGRLHIVTGGPGTGKTYTVRGMLTIAWLHRYLDGASGTPLEVQLAAPTGKAAVRMKESLSDGLAAWCAAVAAAVSAATADRLALDSESLGRALETFLAGLQARTLHRLLGYQSFNPTRFRRSRSSPVPADLVVIDEASMVDLSMMANLFDAIGAETTLVLVGDRRQLASVASGTVLADLCRWGGRAPRPLVELSVSRRFPDHSAVGRFARGSAALDRLGDSEELRAAAASTAGDLFEASGTADAGVRVDWIDERTLASELDAVAACWVEAMCELSTREYRIDENGQLEVEGRSADSHALWRELAAMTEAVRVLTPHRSGRRGVEALNDAIWQRIKRQATARGLFDPSFARGSTRSPCVGKPVIVTTNDYEVRRFNGDVGVWVRVRPPGETTARLMALFQGADGRVDAHAQSVLPEHDAVWAMTVHKSQGSEFEKVVFVLPERTTPLLTRELIYTGITRVKRHLVVVGERGVLVEGLVQTTRRASGLAERLESRRR